VQEAAYFGRLQDGGADMLGEILSLFDAVPKHNPRLLESASADESEDAAVQQAIASTSLYQSRTHLCSGQQCTLGRALCYLCYPGLA
jgi:hypothetical protein